MLSSHALLSELCCRVTVVALMACPLASLSAERVDSPNIVVIYADDHAQHAISAFGSRINSTPNIDRLASDGMRFTQSFVANSICGPSRATLLTGLHSQANGQTSNRSSFRDDLPTFVKSLQETGYSTAMIGKWHISTPPNGFDYWAIKKGGYYNPTFETPEGSESSTGHVTDVITDRSCQWMLEQRNKPFMLWISHSAVHRTWDPPLRHLDKYSDDDVQEPSTLFDDYRGRNSGATTAQMRISRDLFPAYDLKLPATGDGVLDQAASGRLLQMTPEQRRVWNAAFAPRNEQFKKSKLKGDDLTRWNYQRYIKNYLRNVDGLDESVGTVRRFLQENGLANNTIVVYTSDQGFFLGDHGWYDKRWMYEESMRTPLIIRWPEVTEPGSDCSLLVQNIDMAPTFLEAANCDIPESMHGESLGSLLRGETPNDWREAVYYHYQMIEPSSRTSHLVPRHYGIRTVQYKLIHYYDLDSWELYDLTNDKHELHNLYEDREYAPIVASLTQQLSELRKEYDGM